MIYNDTKKRNHKVHQGTTSCNLMQSSHHHKLLQIHQRINVSLSTHHPTFTEVPATRRSLRFHRWLISGSYLRSMPRRHRSRLGSCAKLGFRGWRWSNYVCLHSFKLNIASENRHSQKGKDPLANIDWGYMVDFLFVAVLLRNISIDLLRRIEMDWLVIGPTWGE